MRDPVSSCMGPDPLALAQSGSRRLPFSRVRYIQVSGTVQPEYRLQIEWVS